MRMTWEQQNPFRFKDDFSTSGLSVSTLKEINCQDGKSNSSCFNYDSPKLNELYELITKYFNFYRRIPMLEIWNQHREGLQSIHIAHLHPKHLSGHSWLDEHVDWQGPSRRAHQFGCVMCSLHSNAASGRGFGRKRTRGSSGNWCLDRSVHVVHHHVAYCVCHCAQYEKTEG